MTAAPSTFESTVDRLARPRTLTLLDLVSELVDLGVSDQGVVNAVGDLIDSGRVRLVGQITDADLRVLQ